MNNSTITVFYGVPLTDGLREYAKSTINNPRFFQTYKFTELHNIEKSGHYGYLGTVVGIITEPASGFRLLPNSIIGLEVSSSDADFADNLYNQLPDGAKEVLEEEGYAVDYYIIWSA